MMSDVVNKAAWFAEKMHKGQLYDGQDYFLKHLKGVVAVMTDELGVTDPETIAIGYLHDVVEDTEVPISVIEKLFGKVVADGVGLMTNHSSSYDVYVKAIKDSGNEKAITIKLADATFNYRSCLIAGGEWLKHAPRYLSVIELLATKEQKKILLGR